MWLAHGPYLSKYVHFMVHNAQTSHTWPVSGPYLADEVWSTPVIGHLARIWATYRLANIR